MDAHFLIKFIVNNHDIGIVGTPLKGRHGHWYWIQIIPWFSVSKIIMVVWPAFTHKFLDSIYVIIHSIYEKKSVHFFDEQCIGAYWNTK